MNISARRRRLSGQEFTDVDFNRADLRGALAYGSVWRNCVFHACQLGQADFRDAVFDRCVFDLCDLTQAVLVGRIRDTAFGRSNLDQATLVGAIIERSTFIDCRLQYALFSRATVTDTAFKDSNMHGAILDFAYTQNVDFSGSNLWGIVAPFSCALTSSNVFDGRQVQYMLALILHAKLPEAERRKLEMIVDPKVRKAVRRLVQGQEDGMDAGGWQPAEMALEVAGVGSGLRAPDGDHFAAVAADSCSEGQNS
jgi:hypothetical protein